jgi:energy-coupling factor transport system ATP-binding protein
VSHEYSKGIPVLSEIDADFFLNQNVGIIGENGCGKSTLSRIIAELFTPTKGTAKRPISRELRVNYVAQLPDSQLFESTVYGELMLGARLLGMNEQDVHSEVMDLSKRMGIVQYLELSPLDLSYGLKKIIPTMSCLITHPDLLVIDEGTVGLDHQLQVELSSMISEYSFTGTTFILVSHDFDFLYPLCDRFILLQDGRLVKDSKKELFWDFISNSLYLQDLSADRIQSEKLLLEPS